MTERRESLVQLSLYRSFPRRVWERSVNTEYLKASCVRDHHSMQVLGVMRSVPVLTMSLFGAGSSVAVNIRG